MSAGFVSYSTGKILMEEQEKVAEFIDRYDLEGKTAFRILDLVSEIWEIAADAAKSSNYGLDEEDLQVGEDEIGDALFSLLAVSEDLGIDAEEALEKAMEKYRGRIEDRGSPGSR